MFPIFLSQQLLFPINTHEPQEMLARFFDFDI